MTCLSHRARHLTAAINRCHQQHSEPKVLPRLLQASTGQYSLIFLRRNKIVERVAKEKGIVVIFLESVCDDPAVIAANIALKVSSGDPDYKDMSREKAKADFERRIREYEAVYETITEPHLSYLRIKNVGSQVTLCHIHGYLQSRIAFYLMNLHLKPRSIFFSRVGGNCLGSSAEPLTAVIARRESVQCRRQDWRRLVAVGPRDDVRQRVARAYHGQHRGCASDGQQLWLLGI